MPQEPAMNFQIVLDALVKIFTDIVNFIPNLVNGLIILLGRRVQARDCND